MAVKPSDSQILQSYTLDELIDLVKEKAKMDVEAKLSEAKDQLVSLLSGKDDWSEPTPAQEPEQTVVKVRRRGRPKASDTETSQMKTMTKGRGRAGRGKKIPLGKYLEQVLTSEPQKVDEIMKALKAAGYRSTSKDPRRILYLELTKQVKNGVVKKSGRGLYSLKK